MLEKGGSVWAVRKILMGSKGCWERVEQYERKRDDMLQYMIWILRIIYIPWGARRGCAIGRIICVWRWMICRLQWMSHLGREKYECSKLLHEVNWGGRDTWIDMRWRGADRRCYGVMTSLNNQILGLLITFVGRLSEEGSSRKLWA
jgi:hypothetical protein